MRGGAALILLGPDQAVLAEFEQYWSAELNKLARKNTEAMGLRRRPVPKPGNLERISLLMDDPDRSKPNGTSIAFVIENRNVRALFLSDAHPSTIISSLRSYSPYEKCIEFDVIKVAHHGSAANNTSTLLNLLQSPLWLISSDGSRHQHPDPEAIARLVLTPIQDKVLLFNYRTKFNETWAQPDLSKYYRYEAKYADASISIEL
jgi:beta-lactamase superfamily II metal-dependent hydrolase